MNSGPIKHLDVICYKWGTLYPPDYVNILYRMVGRQLSAPHTFHCITDDPDGLDDGVTVHQLPDYGVEGIWRKLMTFQEDFLGLKGKYVVSIDIDVVVVGPLDFLLERPEEDFIIARNWTRSGTRGSGSLYRLRVGSHPEIWNEFIGDTEKAIDRYHGKNRLVGEQNWLNAHFETFEYFPDGKVVSFKRHCGSRGHIVRLAGREIINTARFGKASPPQGAALVSFHGDPSPADVMYSYFGRWRHAPFVQEYWR